MNPFDSMMVVLSDIRDGIYSLVDKFSEKCINTTRRKIRRCYGTRLITSSRHRCVALQMKTQIQEINKVSFQKAKDKVKRFTRRRWF